MAVPEPTVSTKPGFGTAHLMGRIGARESTRLVHAALDAGITHFDTARVYGFGDAEAMLGKALRGRSSVAVYTKVGQGPSHHSGAAAKVRALGRPVARWRARLAQAGGRADITNISFVRRTDFSPDYVRHSVQTSLRLLQRDALDGLLLHEATISDTSQELVALIETLVKKGMIRRFGIASEHMSLSKFDLQDSPYDVIQQSGGPFAVPIKIHGPAELNLHSLFGQKGQDLRLFRTWLNENAHFLYSLTEIVEAESLDSIPALLLSYTSTRWNVSRVIFASTSERHIQDNAVAVQHKLSSGNLDRVAEILDNFIKRDRPGDSC